MEIFKGILNEIKTHFMVQGLKGVEIALVCLIVFDYATSMFVNDNFSNYLSRDGIYVRIQSESVDSVCITYDDNSSCVATDSSKAAAKGNYVYVDNAIASYSKENDTSVLFTVEVISGEETVLSDQLSYDENRERLFITVSDEGIESFYIN